MRRVGSCLRHVSVFGMLLGACLLLSSSARGDEESEAAWLAGGAYTRVGAHEEWGRSHPVWENAEQDAEGNPWLVVLFPGFDGPQAACDVYRHTDESGNLSFTVRRRKALEQEGSDLVLHFGLGFEATPLVVAGYVVHGLGEVEDEWNAAAAVLREAEEAYDEDAARLAARRAARTLERLRAKVAWHCGLMRDLLGAYQLLLGYEVGTDRGANISFLWRALLEDWQRGASSDADWRIALFAHLNLVFVEGCYAQVAAMLAEFGVLDDPLAAPLVGALDRLGQRDSVEISRESLGGARGSVIAATLETAGDPPEGAPLFHRRTWLLYRGDGSDIPLPVWFSLTRDAPEDGPSRWGVFGWVGGTRRLLALYGDAEPEAAAVDDLVLGLVRKTAGPAEGDR